MDNETDKADRLTFWRGWWEGSRYYPDEQRLAIYDAIFGYAFEAREPEAPKAGDLTAAIVYGEIAHIRATIDISRKRRQAGAIGGSKGEATPKQTRSKTEANAKQDRSNAKQKCKSRNQDKEQDKGQDKEHTATPARARGRKPPSLGQFLAGAVLAGVPEDFATGFYNDLVAAGWEDADGVYVANWRRYLRSSYLDAVKKNSPARVGNSLDELPIAR